MTWARAIALALVLTTTGCLADQLPRQAASVATSASGGSHGDGYDRPLFGKEWADVDKNNCDTRNDELKTQILGPTAVLATDGCRVLGGTFIDPYTGRQLEFRVGNPQPVQVDHVIPLHLAYHWGADDWTPEERLLFANDPGNLVPTTLNSTKGDQGPAELLESEQNPRSKWKPSHVGRCTYAQMFTLTAAKWQMDVPTTERRAIAKILRGCR